MIRQLAFICLLFFSFYSLSLISSEETHKLNPFDFVEVSEKEGSRAFPFLGKRKSRCAVCPSVFAGAEGRKSVRSKSEILSRRRARGNRAIRKSFLIAQIEDEFDEDDLDDIESEGEDEEEEFEGKDDSEDDTEGEPPLEDREDYEVIDEELEADLEDDSEGEEENDEDEEEERGCRGRHG